MDKTYDEWGFRSFPQISDELASELQGVIPSSDHGLKYRPCEVILRSGEHIDHVYVQESDEYLKTWGILPEYDSHKFSVDIADVVELHSSPSRLPVKFANELYEHGETRMGGCFFTVEFRDGTRQEYGTGNAIDFIEYPEGLGPDDVAHVIPHKYTRGSPKLSTAKYFWCLYSKESYR